MLLNTQIKQNKKQGVTLVEVLIVLAIAAVVIAGALVLYGNLQRNSAVNEETTNLSAMFQNIDNFFRRGSTAGLTNAEAVQAGFIPGGMYIDDSGASVVIENAFGGQVFITGAGVDAANTKGFAIEYTRVPQAACVNFVQGQARVGWDTFSVVGDLGVATVQGNTNPLFYRTADATTGSGRGSETISELAIIDACATSEDYVSVQFVKDSEA